jgi:RND family efflux transporter MFP subunit
MNKYVLRTSLLWMVVLAIGAGIWAYRSHRTKQPQTMNMPMSGEVQPVAAGPSPAVQEPVPSMGERKMETALVPVQLTPERMQSIGVKTDTAEYKQLSDDIRATGTVDINERLLSYVQVRFPGYIRKVFANATYQYVRKGEPLFTIYSPELVATQQEYLLAKQNQKALSASTVDGVASGAESLSAAAEQRLEQWEVPQSEIAKLKETGKPVTDLTINSPVTGYITERNALPNMYAEPSTKLYTVADLSRVWVYAQIFQNDIGRIKPGDTAQITVDSYPGRTFSGQIEEILPQVDMATRTVRVRLAIANAGLRLKPGMFVDVDLKTSLGRQLVVPASAVFQSGRRQLVFLNHGSGSLEPKEITLGPRVGDDFIVLKGLESHQSIVTSANFLIDSESQLQAAAGSFVPPPPGSGGVAAPSNKQQAAQATIDFTTNPNPPQKGNNTFHVKLAGADGVVITGADVTVTFYMAAMPAMSMAAMNTTAKLNDKGNGLYEGTGALGSGGTWQVTISVQKNGQVIATKQLRVNATGGM